MSRRRREDLLRTELEQRDSGVEPESKSGLNMVINRIIRQSQTSTNKWSNDLMTPLMSVCVGAEGEGQTGVLVSVYRGGMGGVCICVYVFVNGCMSRMCWDCLQLSQLVHRAFGQTRDAQLHLSFLSLC